jgi:hypothetical protein
MAQNRAITAIQNCHARRFLADAANGLHSHFIQTQTDEQILNGDEVSRKL